jgi:glyoxylase-like metal-dependent hydrolase (beta-lactamase superfamily II)
MQFDTVEEWRRIYAGAGLSDIQTTGGPFAMMTARGFLADEGSHAIAVMTRLHDAVDLSAQDGLVVAADVPRGALPRLCPGRRPQATSDQRPATARMTEHRHPTRLNHAGTSEETTMSTPLVVPMLDEGLGNTSYLVDLGDGRALVVDASVDLRSVRSTTEQVGLKVAYAADTHLHADFLSGARQLGSTDGAVVLASAAGDRQFAHAGLVDGQEVDLGGLRLTTLVTPGHTTEHVSFLLSDGQRPLGVFTGGSLLVGAAARTDLVDPDRTVELARAQYRSLQRLMSLPDDVEVWPTHGAGSFCSAPPGDQPTRAQTVCRRAGPACAVDLAGPDLARLRRADCRRPSGA